MNLNDELLIQTNKHNFFFFLIHSSLIIEDLSGTHTLAFVHIPAVKNVAQTQVVDVSSTQYEKKQTMPPQPL